MELAGQLDPEQWHAILERFFEILTEGVHRFEGTVNQDTGDGIMALSIAASAPRRPRWPSDSRRRCAWKRARTPQNGSKRRWPRPTA